MSAYLLSERDFGRVAKVVRTVEGETQRAAIPNVSSRVIPQPVSITFRNDSSETIPAYGCLAITGAEQNDDRLIFVKGEKPSSTACKSYAVNGPVDVEKNRYGQCFTSSWTRVLYDTGTPEPGDLYGPKASQWTISKDSNAIVACLGILDEVKRIMLAQFLAAPAACRFYIGTTTGAVTAGTGFHVSSLTALDGGAVPDPDHTGPDTWNVGNAAADGDGYAIDTAKVGKIIGWADGTLHPLDFPCPA